ncbi:MAG TPA: AEC family transporter [Clostridiales bacterium]|nr:AEC family transporter [Clostridiales bacterium]
MESLFFTINALAPTFAIVVLGYLFKRYGLFNDNFLTIANKFCFRVALPCLLFKNITQYGIQGFLKGPYILFVVLSILFAVGVLMTFIPLVVHNRKKCGAIIQGIFRSNYIILGLPIVINMFGEDKIGSAAALVPFSIIVYNFMAVMVLSWFSHGKEVNPLSWSLVKKIATNPLIIGSLLGIIYVLMPAELPSIILKPVFDLASLATPLALLAVGGQFQLKTVKNNRKELFLTVVGRLAIMPAIFLFIAVLLGYRGTDLAPLIVLFGGPTAVSSYVMAKDMDSDSDLAAQIVIFSTLFSMVTLFGWVFLMRSLGFL